MGFFRELGRVFKNNDAERDSREIIDDALRAAARAEQAAAAARKRIEDERISLGYYEPYLLDIRPRRPALNPNYTIGSGAPKYLGEEYFNPRTGETISDDDAWLLAENRRKKYPELLASFNPKEPLSKVSRGKYADALTKRAKVAQQTFDRFTPFGLDYRAGNHYGQVDYSKHSTPIPEGERWLDHNEEIEQILTPPGKVKVQDELEALKDERAKILEKSYIKDAMRFAPHLRIVRIRTVLRRRDPEVEKEWLRFLELERRISEKQPLATTTVQTEPVRFWWDKDADLTPVESMKRSAAVLPTRRLQVMLPPQNSNIEMVPYELPSKHNENIGIRRIKAIPFEKATPFKTASAFEKATPFKTASAFKAATPASKYRG